jgi:hypothetical protein
MQVDERTKLIREKAREAIALAMDSRWNEAAAVNRELLEMDSNDIDASNRLGKALLELGDCPGARQAFERTLNLAPDNTIAKKNLERISASGGVARQASTQRITPQLFIEDSGKTTQVSLLAPAPHGQRSAIAGGAQVELRKQGDTMAVCDSNGTALGLLPPLLGARLLKLIQGGNRYDGAVSSNTPEQITVLLRETFQHPSQRSVVSFPARERVAQPAEAEDEPKQAAMLAKDADEDADEEEDSLFVDEIDEIDEDEDEVSFDLDADEDDGDENDEAEDEKETDDTDTAPARKPRAH